MKLLLILMDPCFQGNWGPCEFVSFSRQSCDFLSCPLQNEQKNVKMMNRKGLFRIGFIEELKAQILELRYTKGTLSMFVLLPSCSTDNLKGLEEVSLHFPVSTKHFIVDLGRAALSTIYHLEEGWHLSNQRGKEYI